MRAGEEREHVDAVGADDGDRREEEDEQPPDRQSEQARRRQVQPRGKAAVPRHRRFAQAAFTSSQTFAYTARRGMSRSRCAFGSVTAFGFVSWSACSRSLEAGRASVFAWP